MKNRGRKRITTRKVEKLMAATKGSFNEARDRCRFRFVSDVPPRLARVGRLHLAP